MAQVNCIVVTPERTAVDQHVEFVALPMYDGELGVAAGHSPLIGRLGYGELRLRSGGKVEKYYIDGGFVQVADDVVSILTNRAIAASNIDIEGARKQLAQAKQRRANTPKLMEQREREVAQARAQLHTAGESSV